MLFIYVSPIILDSLAIYVGFGFEHIHPLIWSIMSIFNHLRMDGFNILFSCISLFTYYLSWDRKALYFVKFIVFSNL